MGNEKEKILRDLKNSGFPTEIKVTEYLKSKSELNLLAHNKCHWHYINQESYLDGSENKIRSIDLFAIVRWGRILTVKPEENKIIKLYIECKKSDNAKWVFYTKPQSLLAYQVVPILDLSIKDLKYNPFDYVPVSYNTIKPHIGLTHQIAFRKNDDFYSAQMQALKAIYYCEKKPQMKDVKTLIIPVVVFEGGMYRYDVTKEDPEIHEIRYLRYQSHGIPESPIPLYVDVVHIDFFSEYIKLIEKEIIAL